MADYTAFVEAGTALNRTDPGPADPGAHQQPELISLCSPHESENNQLTLFSLHIEEEGQNVTAGYYQVDRELQRMQPARYTLRYLVTAHSKAPSQMREADQHRIIGAAMQAIRDNPVIPARYLTGSSAEEAAELHVMVEKTPLEQLLKIWNNTSKDYKLSFVAMVTGVTIRSRRERRVSRVREITIDTKERPAGGAQ